MKRVKMIVTSVVVLAIVGSAFAFNAKKIGKFCVTTSGGNGTNGSCYTILNSYRTTGTTGIVTLKYYVDWDGVACNGFTSGDTQKPVDCSTTTNFHNND